MLRYVFLFFAYSFVGWCFESTVVSVSQRRPVNRGFLFGPVCPIYGTCAVLMALTLARFTHNIAVLLFAGMLIATFVEFLTGWGMEKLFHTRWWDYSDAKLNIAGYVSLKSSLVWGVLSVLLMRFLHPWVFSLFDKLPVAAAEAIVVAGTFLFGADAGISTYNAVDIAKWTERFHQALHEVRGQIDLRLDPGGLAAKLHLPEGQRLLNRLKLRMLNAYPRMRARNFPDVMALMRARLVEARAALRPRKKKRKDDL